MQSTKQMRDLMSHPVQALARNDKLSIPTRRCAPAAFGTYLCLKKDGRLVAILRDGRTKD